MTNVRRSLPVVALAAALFMPGTGFAKPSPRTKEENRQAARVGRALIRAAMLRQFAVNLVGNQMKLPNLKIAIPNASNRPGGPGEVEIADDIHGQFIGAVWARGGTTVEQRVQLGHLPLLRSFESAALRIGRSARAHAPELTPELIRSVTAAWRKQAKADVAKLDPAPRSVPW